MSPADIEQFLVIKRQIVRAPLVELLERQINHDPEALRYLAKHPAR
ncbi:MAG TPA: hypothetical protein VE907_20275 [Gammaproteobacteria bacterium]|nr:hypothetical protein [Gammaproteobacteria bacterium]